jgi:hypothetical protein
LRDCRCGRKISCNLEFDELSRRRAGKGHGILRYGDLQSRSLDRYSRLLSFSVRDSAMFLSSCRRVPCWLVLAWMQSRPIRSGRAHWITSRSCGSRIGPGCGWLFLFSRDAELNSWEICYALFNQPSKHDREFRIDTIFDPASAPG